MKLRVVEKTFKDKEGKVIGYKALAVQGYIDNLPFEVVLKPFDESKVIKNALINNADKCEVVVTKSVHEGIVYEKVITTLGELGDISFKVSSSDLFIIKLAIKLESAK